MWTNNLYSLHFRIEMKEAVYAANLVSFLVAVVFLEQCATQPNVFHIGK